MKRRSPPRTASSALRQTLPLIYLAGPITGCNELQRVEWRRDIKARFGHKFRFVDPTETPISQSDEESRFTIAREDAEAIRQADAVLANMWKESIGTAIGVVEARRAGKLVVLVDRNYIQSTFLAYFVDAVARSVEDGLRQIEVLLSTQRRLEAVVKRGGETREPFDREKLARSIRGACTSARKNDVLGAAEIVPRVIAALLQDANVKDGQVPSKAIRNAVHSTLEELAESPLRGTEFAGVREAWDHYVHEKQREKEKDRLELLREAYEGLDWRRRIAAEIELSGACPMNALRLCTQFENAWLVLGRHFGVVSDAPGQSVRDLGTGVFHTIARKADALKRTGELPKHFPAVEDILVEARRSRNAIIHSGAFGRSDALTVLTGLEALSAIGRVVGCDMQR